MSAFLLIGTIVTGIAAASVVMIVFRLAGRRAPRWSLPAVAGLTMLTMNIAIEGSWFRRIQDQLSERVVVVESFERALWWRPWTYVWPQTVRFTAIDADSAERMGAALVQVEVWLVDRFQGSVRVVQVYDCERPRRADRFDAEPDPRPALPAEDAWVTIDPDDALRRAACSL